ncbi:hypothetical protein ACHAQJ_009714 [Trichoderma viride]
MSHPSSVNAARTPPDEQDIVTSNRRKGKACDLCFTKKIKCDTLKPVCSNCVLYSAKCKTSIIQHKVNIVRERPTQLRRLSHRDTRPEAVEARLARIEKQLHQVLDSAQATHTANLAVSYIFTPESPRVEQGSSSSSSSNASSSYADRADARTGGDYQNPPLRDVLSNEWTVDLIEPRFHQGSTLEGLLMPSIEEALPMPPLEEALPIIEHYFRIFNSGTPIFDQGEFMSMMNNWYSNPATRNRATWAALQIVLALSLRVPEPGVVDSGPQKAQLANSYLRNAQSVVSELVMRDSDLLGIQVLLCIVILFQDSVDPKPSSVIVGTAMGLAHRLQLHSSSSARYLSPEETKQRILVFWIAYTLEKDISLRARTPSVQNDDDIDIPLPPVVSPDGTGVISTLDGRNHFNHFRHRIDLAYIQGKIYNLLYSSRAAKTKGEERKRRISHLQAMLDLWYQRIPAAFHIEHVASTVSPGSLVQMTKMHHEYLLSEVMTHGIYSRSADWIGKLSTVSRLAIQDITSHCAAAPDGSKDQAPPLPAGWTKCVEVSRGCMKLFQETVPTECLVWQCCCAHFSGLIILLANMVVLPSHPLISLDQHLTSKALHLFDKVADIRQDSAFDHLRAVVGVLDQKARAAVDQNEQVESSIFGEFNTGFEDFSAADRFGFSTLGNNFDLLMSGFEAESQGPFQQFADTD